MILLSEKAYLYKKEGSIYLGDMRMHVCVCVCVLLINKKLVAGFPVWG